jgi:hypothetical protein
VPRPRVLYLNFLNINIWDRCYDYKNIFAEKLGKNVGVFDQTTAVYKKIDHNIGFGEKRPFFP